MPFINYRPFVISEKIKSFVFEKAVWISFFIVIIFVFWGFLFFYSNAWTAVNSVFIAPEIKLPLNQPLWRIILDDVNQRRLLKMEPQSVKDIFR